MQKYNDLLKQTKTTNEFHDGVIFVGTFLNHDNEKLYNQMLEFSQNKPLVYFSPIEDINLSQNAKYFCKYEIASEEAVFSLMCKFLTKNLTSKISDFVDELDIGYISAESNIGEEEIEKLNEIFKSCKNITLILGKDVFFHKSIENIIKLISVLTNFSNISILSDIKSNINEILIPDIIEELESFDGIMIYEANKNENFLIGSAQFAQIAKIKQNEKIQIITKDTTYHKTFILDENLKGTIGILYTTNSNTYRYKSAKILKENS